MSNQLVLWLLPELENPVQQLFRSPEGRALGGINYQVRRRKDFAMMAHRTAAGFFCSRRVILWHGEPN